MQACGYFRDQVKIPMWNDELNSLWIDTFDNVDVTDVALIDQYKIAQQVKYHNCLAPLTDGIKFTTSYWQRLLQSDI